MGGGGRLVVFLLCVAFGETSGERGSQGGGGGKLYSLEGKVELLSANDSSWMSHTRILVDGGKYQGFIRTDGTFTINGLPNGAYIVEVTHPRYEFSPARVYIFRDGRKRASKLDLIQPNHVHQIKYPLLFREVKKIKFFQERATLKLEDIIYNPMVVTFLLPLMFVLMFPKMLNQSFLDPKVQDQFKRQLSTMTGGRGDMIGMGVSNEEKKEDDSSEGETTNENSEKKNKKKKRPKESDKQKMQMPSLFTFDLAEILTNYFYEEKPAKPPEKISHLRNNRRRKRGKQ